MKKTGLAALLINLAVLGTTQLTGNNNQALAATGSSAAQAKVLNIKSHGAVGDGVAMDTEPIQAHHRCMPYRRGRYSPCPQRGI